MTFKRLSKTSVITICSVGSSMWESIRKRNIIQVQYFMGKDSMRGDVIVEYEDDNANVVGYHEQA